MVIESAHVYEQYLRNIIGTALNVHEILLLI